MCTWSRGEAVTWAKLQEALQNSVRRVSKGAEKTVEPACCKLQKNGDKVKQRREEDGSWREDGVMSWLPADPGEPANEHSS